MFGIGQDTLFWTIKLPSSKTSSNLWENDVICNEYLDVDGGTSSIIQQGSASCTMLKLQWPSSSLISNGQATTARIEFFDLPATMLPTVLETGILDPIRQWDDQGSHRLWLVLYEVHDHKSWKNPVSPRQNFCFLFIEKLRKNLKKLSKANNIAKVVA
jgi:hypothetical protein